MTRRSQPSGSCAAAYDILTDAGIEPAKAFEMVAEAEYRWLVGTTSRTPEESARVFARWFKPLHKMADEL